MRANLCVAILIVLACIFFAEGIQAEPTQYGFKLGLNFDNLTGEVQPKYLEPTSKKGYTLGFFARIPTRLPVYIEPGLYAVTKGAKAKDDKRSDQLNLKYFEIPILGRIIFNEGRKIQPNVVFGAAVELLYSAEYVFGIYSFDVMDDMFKMDYSFIYGAGFIIKTEKRSWEIEGRFVLGQSTIEDSEDKLDIKTKSFVLSIGIIF